MVPIEEIRRAKGSILDYCKQHNISLTKNKEGKTVLKGREYVVVKEFETVNTKNSTSGSLIDFVAAHHNLTYLQAAAKITNNPRLLLLEKATKQKGREFTSFYIPKQDRLPEPESQGKLSGVLSSWGTHSQKVSEHLIKSDRTHVSKNGNIRMFGENDGSGTLELIQGVAGTWSKQSHGSPRKPFYSSDTLGKHASIYLGPESFLKAHGENIFARGHGSDGILAVLHPHEPLIDQYLSRNKQVSRVSLLGSNPGKMTKVELDFFENLKKRYQHLGIEWMEPAHEREAHHRGMDLSR